MKRRDFLTALAAAPAVAKVEPKATAAKPIGKAADPHSLEDMIRYLYAMQTARCVSTCDRMTYYNEDGSILAERILADDGQEQFVSELIKR